PKNFVRLKNLVAKNLIEMESFARAKNIVEVKGLVEINSFVEVNGFVGIGWAEKLAKVEMAVEIKDFVAKVGDLVMEVVVEVGGIDEAKNLVKIEEFVKQKY
ncbi:19722_t:CDS:1, partial [Gigaspora rosea]